MRPDNTVIGHLFAAGEAGSITANQYQAGQDVAELLIFGKIAGENAAKSEELSTNFEVENIADLSSDEGRKEFKVNKNQYIGSSNSGMGNELVVRVTVEPNTKKIIDVEVLQQSETEDIGQKALAILPQEVIDKNSTDVDAVSAFKEAVNNALEKMNDKTDANSGASKK